MLRLCRSNTSLTPPTQLNFNEAEYERIMTSFGKGAASAIPAIHISHSAAKAPEHRKRSLGVELRQVLPSCSRRCTAVRLRRKLPKSKELEPLHDPGANGGAHQLIANPSTRKAPDKHCVFSGDAKVARVRIPIDAQSLVAMPADAPTKAPRRQNQARPRTAAKQTIRGLSHLNSDPASMISGTTEATVGPFKSCPAQAARTCTDRIMS